MCKKNKKQKNLKKKLSVFFSNTFQIIKPLYNLTRITGCNYYRLTVTALASLQLYTEPKLCLRSKVKCQLLQHYIERIDLVYNIYVYGVTLHSLVTFKVTKPIHGTHVQES